jgi:hypothetical protein
MKKLKVEPLKSRRRFLIGLAKKAAVPVVAIYGIDKSAPKLFAREPE